MLPHPPLRAAALLALALLAGCASPSPAPGTPAAPTDAAAAPPLAVREHFEFQWEAGAGAPGVPAQDLQALSSPDGGPFDVPAGTRQVNVTVAWTCSTPTCTVRAGLFPPGGGEPGPASSPALHAEGPSPLRLEVRGPAQGTWILRVYSSGATAGVVGKADVQGA
jgi:hypothetical protein